MDYKVEFKDSFLEDLERVVTVIAEQNQPAARKLGELLVKSAETLEFFPERHPRVRQRPALRRYVVARNYKVFYRVCPETQTVEILRCWDGRQGADPMIES